MLVDDILERNRGWVRDRKPTPLPPAVPLRLAVVACYDPRLDPLLLPALGLRPGDAFLLRSAGALLQPGSTTLRSLGLAIFMFGVTEVLVVGHTACRMATFDSAGFIEEFRRRGVPREAFGSESLRTWAGAIASPRQGVLQSVATAREVPFLPADVRVSGVVLDETSGALELVARADDASNRDGGSAAATPPGAATSGHAASARAAAEEAARERRSAADEAAIRRATASRFVRHRTASGPTRRVPGASRGLRSGAVEPAPGHAASSPGPSSRGALPRPGAPPAESGSTRAATVVAPPPPPPSPAFRNGNPRLAQTRTLLEAADRFLATIESKEHWRQDLENLRAELERRPDARQRLELLDAFARRLGTDSREVAESFARLRREIAAAGHDPAAELLSVFHHLGRRR